TVTFSDATNHVTVLASSRHAALSALIYCLNITLVLFPSDAGNTASANGASIDLDTSADLGAPLTLSITDTTINNAEKTAVAFTRSEERRVGEGGAATVTFSDGTKHVKVEATAGRAEVSSS